MGLARHLAPLCSESIHKQSLQFIARSCATRSHENASRHGTPKLQPGGGAVGCKRRSRASQGGVMTPPRGASSGGKWQIAM